MKLIARQIEKTSLPELAGFNAEKTDAAVRSYLKLYEENSKLPRFFDFAVRDVDLVTHPIGSIDFYVEEVFKGEIPISSDESVFKDGVTLGLSLAENDKNMVDRSAQYTNCHDLKPKDVALALKLIDRINKQLKSAGMPRLFFKPELLSAGEPIPNNPLMHVRSCNAYKDKSVAGTYNDSSSYRSENNTAIFSATIRLYGLLLNPTKTSVLAHEISHMFADHPQDVVDLSKVDREVLTYMCSYSDRAGTRGSSLIYNSACINQGVSIPIVPLKNLGTMEMLTLKKFYSLTEAERHQDVEQAIGEIVKDIRVQYSTRTASQAMGGFFAALVFTSMACAVSNSGTMSPKAMLKVVSVFSQLVGLAVMVSQMPDQAVMSLIVAAGFASVGQVSQVGAAFSKLVSSAGLSMAFLSLFNGQSGVAVGLAAGYGGTLAGRLCAEIFNTLRTATLERSAVYLQAHGAGPDADNADNLNFLCARVQTTLARATPEPLRNVMSKIGEMDKLLARFIGEYPTFNFVYNNVLNERQRPIEEDSFHSAVSDMTFHTAQEASFHDAQVTLDEVGPDQAVELEVCQITSHDQLQAVDLARNLFVDPELGTTTVPR